MKNTPDTEKEHELRVKDNELTKNFHGMKFTPDTEWEKQSAKIAIESHKLSKNYAQFSECIYQGIKSVVSSRDTYWKERVRKAVEGMPTIELRAVNGINFNEYIRKDTLLDNLK